MATSSMVMTVEQLREAERRTMLTTPESELMDRAADAVAAEARGAAEARTGTLERAKIVVLAGSGNNGGDALLAGALLSGLGAEVVAVQVSTTAHERGLAELAAAGGSTVRALESLEDALSHVRTAHCAIDGIVGLGAQAGLREPATQLVNAIPLTTAVVAVDIPSGLEADSNLAGAPHVHASVTVTFTALKRCLAARPASASAGLVVLKDVGVLLP